MRQNRKTTPTRKPEQGPREHDNARTGAKPDWIRPVDLYQHPPLDMAPVEPIDWSSYVASRMHAYEHAW